MKKAFFDRRTAHFAEQEHIPLVGCSRVTGQWAERRQARFAQHQRRLKMGQVAAVVENVRCEHAGFTCLGLELDYQFFAGAVAVAARIVFIRSDHVAHEALDALGDISGLCGDLGCHI
jgi:hypothetical protein